MGKHSGSGQSDNADYIGSHRAGPGRSGAAADGWWTSEDKTGNTGERSASAEPIREAGGGGDFAPPSSRS